MNAKRAHGNPFFARVTPDGVKDLSKRKVTRNLACVIKTLWVRSLALLGMTAYASWLALPKPPLLDGIPFSQVVRDRDGNVLRLTLSADQKFRIRTVLRDVSPELIGATLQFEDKHFARHCGVNPVALLRSATSMLPGHARTGGSTITMQLARLRFQLQTRTISGKAIQILRALELERHYSKSEILEAYFNLAPYGRNIEGAAAASEIYLGKQPAHLTRPEAIALSVIPQSPTRRTRNSASPGRRTGSGTVPMLTSPGPCITTAFMKASLYQLIRLWNVDMTFAATSA